VKQSLFIKALVVLCVIYSAQIFAKPDTQNRDEIPDHFKWDFSPIYASWDEWEVGMQEMSTKADEFVKLKGTLKKGPKAILKAYQLFDDIGRIQYLIYRYPQLQRDVDLRNQSVSGRFQQVQAAFAKFNTTTAWFTPELLSIPEKKMRRWLKKNPELAPYRYPIEEAYRRKEHVLDEGGEKLLSYSSQFAGTPRSIYQELSTSDIQFPEVTLSNGETLKMTKGAYGRTLETAREQKDRKAAFEAHYGTYAATKNTYAAIYNSVLQRDWFSAQARDYPTTLAAALDRDSVPVDVYKNLIKTVREGTGPLKRYHAIRQKILKLDEYHGYDGSVPLVETDADYPYEKAREMVVASVGALGEDYQKHLKQFLEGQAVDVYETEGKRSGAYVAGVYGVGPYMLLNYNDTLDAVFTLAHESGHAMHTRLSYDNQPFVTASYTIFVAEVASTINERFLLEMLLSETNDPKERFLLLQKAIENIAGTFYAQVSFADYELQAHEAVEAGKPITAETLSTIYRNVADAYQGENVVKDELYDYLWARIPHFYNSPYYVYKYATCFASSAALYDAMTTGTEEEKAEAKERYLTLLKSGGNDQPMAQLKKAGVDLSKPAAIQAVIQQMDDLVSRLELEADKIMGD